MKQQYSVGCVRNMTKEDVISVCRRLRRDDWFECTLNGAKPLAIDKALGDKYSYTIDIKGNPEGLFGVHRYDQFVNEASIWLVGTETLIKEGWITFTKASKKWLDYLLKENKEYERVKNFVCLHNKVSLKWLDYLGFKGVPKMLVLHNIPFIEIYKENPYYA